MMIRKHQETIWGSIQTMIPPIPTMPTRQTSQLLEPAMTMIAMSDTTGTTDGDGEDGQTANNESDEWHSSDDWDPTANDPDWSDGQMNNPDLF